MTPLPLINAAAMARLLEGLGFVCVRSRGSHFAYRHDDGRMTAIPFHGSEALSIKLIAQIIRQAQLDEADFRRLVSKKP